MNSFELTENAILINGKKTQIISGAIHYFRIPKNDWKDRLLKLKECGFNCVETYTIWSMHEKKEGEFDFSDNLDLARFLDLAKELGLYAIVRPGPYICSETDFGGFPWWLLKYKGIRLRCSDPLYLSKITPYLNEVSKILRPRTFRNGGNVIFVQIENEYGCYGSDKKYLNYIKSIYDDNKLNVDYVTSDNETKFLLTNGGLDGILHSVNYRADSINCIKALKEICPHQIGAVMELWNGHANHYGENTPNRDLKEVADSVTNALKNAELVNVYMFSGGTNYGFMNGSLDCGGNLIVQQTSYDVEAPINEYGQRTDKYYAEQKAVFEYLNKDIPQSKLTDIVFEKIGNAKLEKRCSLDDVIDQAGHQYEFGYLPTMEETDYGYGYIIYETNILIGDKGANLVMPQVHDIAHLYINNDYKKSFYRNNKDNLYFIEQPGEYQIKIIVENMGRVNFGFRLKDFKGLVGDSLIENFDKHINSTVTSFKVTSVPLDKDIDLINSKPILNKPSLYEFSIDVKEPRDCLLKVKGFTRGVVLVNGFNLGRHWDIEFNENKLYLPKHLLKQGHNKIVVFDILDNDKEKSVSLGD